MPGTVLCALSKAHENLMSPTLLFTLHGLVQEPINGEDLALLSLILDAV